MDEVEIVEVQRLWDGLCGIGHFNVSRSCVNLCRINFDQPGSKYKFMYERTLYQTIINMNVHCTYVYC
jgi:hypothetical protein